MHTRRLAGVLLLRQIPVCSSDLENKLAGRVGHPSLCDAGAYSCEVAAMSIKNIGMIKEIYPARRPTSPCPALAEMNVISLSACAIYGHKFDGK